jgi:hypothetical protein
MSKSEKSAYFRHAFGPFFQNVFNGSEFSVKFCIFDTHFEFLLLALFVNFDCKCAGNG